jgi:hypothetical protein
VALTVQKLRKITGHKTLEDFKRDYKKRTGKELKKVPQLSLKTKLVLK